MFCSLVHTSYTPPNSTKRCLSDLVTRYGAMWLVRMLQAWYESSYISGFPTSSQIRQWQQLTLPWLLISARSSHFHRPSVLYSQKYSLNGYWVWGTSDIQCHNNYYAIKINLFFTAFVKPKRKASHECKSTKPDKQFVRDSDSYVTFHEETKHLCAKKLRPPLPKCI